MKQNSYDRWDLSILYNGFDDPALTADVDRLSGAVKEIGQLAAIAGAIPHKDLLHRYIDVEERVGNLAEKLFGYANLVYATDTSDMQATALMGRLRAMLSDIAAPETAIKQAISGMEDLETQIEGDAALKDYAFFLREIKKDSRYLLSEKEEQVFALMNISGASAWEELHDTLTSTVNVKYRGEDITLSAARNLAYDGDPAVRKDAYEAELACYPQIEQSAAFALK